MTRQRVRLHGHDIAYLDLAGDRSGVPVLLVHGVGSSVDTWGDLPQRLAAAGHRVVAVDLLGHGDSGRGNGDYSLGANASTVRDLLDHLGVARAHVVGHSLGGGVSLQLAYQFPERLESLTLVSSGGLGTDVSIGLRAASLPGAELFFRAVTAPGAVRAASWAGRVLDRVGTRPAVLSEKAIGKLERLHDQERIDAFLATVRSVVGPDGQRVSALDKLGGLAPRRVLILWGDADRVLPVQHGIDAAGAIGCRLVIVPGAGHHPHTDAPGLVAAELLAHLAACTPVDAA